MVRVRQRVNRKKASLAPAYDRKAEGKQVRSKPTALRQMISEKRVLELIPIARSTLQAWVKDDTFPKPVPIGARRNAWFADEVAAWQITRRRV
jgi:prophage regulatory protein